MRTRRKFSQSHHGSMNELNITPLLDLAFVLLVIFIITTPQLVNNLEMNLPSGKPPADAPKPKITNILISEAGKIVLNDEPKTLPELKQSLTELHAADKDLTVAVRGAQDVDYQYVISVLDLLQQLDITRVGLATATADTKP
ncbi:MAG: biopolymer transporter ExbD [Verrucomicrobia bacterium]|nr:biopolymer transporter ExbD [Verrucomicrobiota bacterium]NBU07618.1 biopolymer transporter ExbD [Pseudomonadota bacterium]NDB75474.1 biopolymer transporter ExbD [Verrucomicrobiota bacterium]